MSLITRHPVIYLPLIASIGAFDASVHISEEATNASIAVPWALLSAVIIACVLGWGMTFHSPIEFRL